MIKTVGGWGGRRFGSSSPGGRSGDARACKMFPRDARTCKIFPRDAWACKFLAREVRGHYRWFIIM